MKKKSLPTKIFIVEDDVWYSEILDYHLSLNPDNEVTCFRSGKLLLDQLHQIPDIITVDFTLPDMQGDQLLKKIKALNPEIPVIIISGQEDIKVAINLLKEGAYDYIVKDDEAKDRIWNAVNHLKEQQGLKEEISQLKKEVIKKYDFQKNLIGKSESMLPVYDLIEKACKTNINVSIHGETGTGKEVVAKTIHYNSLRQKKSFIAVNVAAIPKELLESELFGHEKGSFTGANSRRIGKFEEADGGTLFLDEIGEMDPSMQAKLLRVLQEREVVRVGSNNPVKIDVRIICATHRDLPEEISKGNFREDLYYRLMGLPVNLPPLRDRSEDIITLSNHFMEQFCKENQLSVLTISNKAKSKLLSYQFPGNVRELKAVIDLACVMTNSDIIEEDHLKFSASRNMNDFLTKEMTLEEYNSIIIKQYLEKYNQNVLLVAKKLDIGKSTIYRMMKENKI